MHTVAKHSCTITQGCSHAGTHTVMTFDRLCVSVLIESPESCVGTWHLGLASRASRWKHTTATKSGTSHSLQYVRFKKELTDSAGQLHLNNLICPSWLLFGTKKPVKLFWLSIFGPKVRVELYTASALLSKIFQEVVYCAALWFLEWIILYFIFSFQPLSNFK